MKPQLSSLSSSTTSFSLLLQMTFSILVSSCSVATTTSYFVLKKSVIHLIYNFTTYELYIFSSLILLTFFRLCFLYSFNYEDLLFSFDQKLVRKPLRGCSYGGELARLGGLARLSEISPSLRKSYKNIMCSYEK